MAKLTLKAVKKATGVGTFVEKTIKFNDVNGKEFEGEILIKVLSHDERIRAADHWKLENKKDVTLDQMTKAIVYEAVHTSKDERFFPDIESTGSVSSEVIDSMYLAVEEALDLTGKNWISKQKNSGENLSLVESVEEPLKKQSET
jgi:hypothetical protein